MTWDPPSENDRPGHSQSRLETAVRVTSHVFVLCLLWAVLIVTAIATWRYIT